MEKTKDTKTLGPPAKLKPKAVYSRYAYLWRYLVIACGMAALYATRYAQKTGTVTISDDHDDFPEEFVICSRPGEPAIYTMNKNEPWAECMHVGDGEVVGIGPRARVARDPALPLVVVEKHEVVLPGLIDAHGHVLQRGEAIDSVDLVGAQSVEEAIERIAAYIDKHPYLKNNKSKFIQGLGWDQTKWPGGQFPQAADLESDPRLAGRRIYLRRIDFHALWVSPSVLGLIGTLPDQVPGGHIERDTKGKATGIFVDNAQDLVMKAVPSWEFDDRLAYLANTAEEMLSRGLTTVHDAMLTSEDINFLRVLDESGRLPIRVYGMVTCVPTNAFCGDDVELYSGKKFTLRAVKLFVDGALGSWGAAMIEPYTDHPEESGILLSPPETFLPLVEKWVDRGFQVNAHAIGDRANQIILDAYEHVLLSRNVSNEVLRLRIEHAQIMTPTDIDRAARLGIIVSMQPTHATSDMDYAEERLGPERIKGAYAWEELRSKGAILALGSDFPVENVNPFYGVHAAVTRTRSDGSSPHGPDGWLPDQKLSLHHALEGFTTTAAYAGFSENATGSLAPGRRADFVIAHSQSLGDVLRGKKHVHDIPSGDLARVNIRRSFIV